MDVFASRDAMFRNHVPCWTGTVYGCVCASQDLGGVGKVLGLLVPNRIAGDQGKGAGGVVLWAHSDGRCPCFFEPRLEMLSRCVGQRRGEGSEFGIARHDGWMDGWMNGLIGVRSNRNC